MNQPKELLRPVKTRYILLSFTVSIMLELLPVNVSTLLWLPDLSALLVLYWSINHPSRVGIVAAFCVGIVMDVAGATYIGQHALAYITMTYFVSTRQRQLVMYNNGHQSLIVLGLLLLSQSIMMVSRLALGASFIGWGYFLPPFIGALLWPFLTKILIIPQRSSSQPR